MKPRSRSILIPLSVLILSSLACSLFSGGAEKPTSPSVPTTAAEEESTASITEPQAQQDTLEPSASGEATGGFTGLDTGLEALSSYRQHFSMSVDGKDDQNQPVSGSLDIVQEIVRKTNDQHVSLSTTGNAFGTGAQTGKLYEQYQVDGLNYIVTDSGDGKTSCSLFGQADNNSNSIQVYNPSDWIGSVENAELVQKGVQVNGIQSDQYRASNKDFAFGAYTAGSADFWLAQDGNYVVKFSGSATGKSVFANYSGDGAIKWQYNLEQPNTLGAIQLPAECESEKPAADIPLPANVTDKTMLSGMISFNSTDDPGTVADFFRTSMPSQGWTSGDESSAGDMIMLTYTKDTRTVNVTITKSDTGTTVIITEQKS
jgi:hypothetical protein